MLQYIVAVSGVIRLLEDEISPAETPEQAAARLLAPIAFELDEAEVIWTDDR